MGFGRHCLDSATALLAFFLFYGDDIWICYLEMTLYPLCTLERLPILSYIFLSSWRGCIDIALAAFERPVGIGSWLPEAT